MHLLVIRVISQSPLVRLYDFLYRHFIKPLPLPMFLVVIVCPSLSYSDMLYERLAYRPTFNVHVRVSGSVPFSCIAQRVSSNNKNTITRTGTTVRCIML